MMPIANEDRISNAIERLTEISSELKAMLAAHEARLNLQEKNTDEIHTTLEKRREEVDIKLKDVYDTMRDQDSKILEEIKFLREDTTRQHLEMSKKITILERYIYLAIGGGICATWIVSYIANYFKILVH
jgi:hypothetical protein